MEDKEKAFNVEPFREAISDGWYNQALFQFKFYSDEKQSFLAQKYEMSGSDLFIEFICTNEGIWEGAAKETRIDLVHYKNNGEVGFTIPMEVQWVDGSMRGDWSTLDEILTYTVHYKFRKVLNDDNS